MSHRFNSVPGGTVINVSGEVISKDRAVEVACDEFNGFFVFEGANWVLGPFDRCEEGFPLFILWVVFWRAMLVEHAGVVGPEAISWGLGVL